MTLFLTSHIGGSQKTASGRIPAPLYDANGFIDELRVRWPREANILLIAADPVDYCKNDSVYECLRVAFPLSNLNIRKFDLLDSRNPQLADFINSYDVVILSGGHVPTQNSFFRSINLKDKLASFSGIIIGISAGTMNCAETVYAHPELEGEAIDPCFQRFIPGLGLTRHMILPHYQSIKDDILDGMRVFEDIAYPDSFGRTFLALNDGSFIIQERGCAILYGEARMIRDGAISLICESGNTITL